MRTIAVLAAALTLTASVSAYEVPWQKIRDACNQYLQVCANKNDVDGIASRLRSRVSQRVSDNPDQSEDVAMRSIMLDWAAGASKDLQKKQSEAIRQACYYFVIFYDKGFDVPHQIREQLSQNNVKELLDYLDSEIAKKKK